MRQKIKFILSYLILSFVRIWGKLTSLRRYRTVLTYVCTTKQSCVDITSSKPFLPIAFHMSTFECSCFKLIHSLTPGSGRGIFTNVIFKYFAVNDVLKGLCKTALFKIPKAYLINTGSCNKWLGVVKQQAITWTNFDPDLYRNVASLGKNGSMRLVPVNSSSWLHVWCVKSILIWIIISSRLLTAECLLRCHECNVFSLHPDVVQNKWNITRRYESTYSI